MRLQHKVTSIIFLFALVIFSSISLIYNNVSADYSIKNKQDLLTKDAVSLAETIERILHNKIYITQSVSAAPIVLKSLIESNKAYNKLSVEKLSKRIENLNQRWKNAKSVNDPFIASYLNNSLSHYLLKQQSVMPHSYGEIFITNRYGAMIATTKKLSTLSHAHKYWWKESYSNGKGKIFLDDRGFDESVQGYVIGVVIPIKKDGEIIGILKSNINIISTLKDVINQYSNNFQGALKIVRTKGLIVLDNINPPLSSEINPKLLKHLKNLETGSVIVTQSGERVDLVAYAPIRLTIDEPNIRFGGKSQSQNHKGSNDVEVWHTLIAYDRDKALLFHEKTNKIFLSIALFLLLLTVLLSYLIGRWISRPIEELSDVAKRIEKGEDRLRSHIHSKDEVGELSYTFNSMLNKLQMNMNVLKVEIEKRQEAEEKIKENEKILVIQSRHAAMGEMVSMIAHQWRQPLTAISTKVINLKIQTQLKTFDLTKPEELEKYEMFLNDGFNSIENYVENLTTTINDFRNFYKPHKGIENSSFKTIVEKSLNIIQASLFDDSIEIKQLYHSAEDMELYASEVMQVVLNIIKNAHDNFIEKEVVNPLITITTKGKTLSICDNGGGIDEKIVDKIFDPYFSTKDELNGTGIGLYMSKIIIEQHHKGKLTVDNTNGGACFTLNLENALLK